MSNGGTATQTTSTSALGQAATPYLTKSMKQAENLYENQKGGKTIYGGKTHVDPSAWTLQGFEQMNENANKLGGAINNQMGNVIGNQGLAGMQNQAGNILQNQMGKAWQNPAMENIQGMASGQYLKNGNPYVDSMVKQSMQEAMDSVGSQAALAGRFGSGVHQGAASEAAMDAAMKYRMQDFNQQQQNQLAANQQVGSLYNNAINQNMNLAGQMAGLGQQGFQNLGSAYDMAGLGAQTKFGLGSMKEGWTQDDINERLRIFNEQKNRPWELLAQKNAILGGAGQIGGTQTTSTTSGSNVPMWQQALGFGTSIFGGLGGFGGF